MGQREPLQKWCWKNWTAPCKRIKLDYFITPYTEIKLKWIKDLNVRPETIKILEENISSTLFHISLSNIFLDVSPQTKETKAKINKWDYIRLKTFCTAKKTIKKTKRLPTGRKKIFANNITD